MYPCVIWTLLCIIYYHMGKKNPLISKQQWEWELKYLTLGCNFKI